MKKFKEKKIKDMEAISGGAGPFKLIPSVDLYFFWNGTIGDEQVCTDKRMKTR